MNNDNELDKMLQRLNAGVGSLPEQAPEHPDAFGRELKVGDVVATPQPGYRNLITGTVVKVTPKKVRVRFKRADWGWSWSHDNGDTEITVDHCQVAKRDP